MKKSLRILLFILLVITLTFIGNNTYAKTKYKYTITYKLDKGTNCSNNPSGFNKNNKKIVLCEPTRKGYQFGGWYTDKAMTKQVATIKKNKNSNVTLYAKWSKNKYYVKYNSNGGTGEMTKSTFKYDTNYKLPANTFTKKGYIFTGWNTKSNGSGTSYKDKEKIKSLTNKNGKTIKLYAQWKPITYYINFNGNGADFGSMSKLKLKYGKKYTLPENYFYMYGLSFVGWNTKSDGTGTSYSNLANVKNLTSKNKYTVTLYAIWKKLVYESSEEKNYNIGYGVTGTLRHSYTYEVDSNGKKKLLSTYDYFSDIDRTNYKATVNDLIPEAKKVAKENKKLINEHLKLLNEYRNSQDSKDLELDDDLTLYACIKAVELYYSGVFSHDSPTGEYWGYIDKATGINSYGENILYGSSTAKDALGLWKTSPGHNANMLNSRWTKIGICAFNNYWVQDFR